MKSTKVLSALTLMSLASTAAFAASSAPTLGSLFENSGINVSGAVAGSLRQNLSVPNPGQARSNFQLDQALLSVAYQPKEGFGAVLDVASGQTLAQAGQVGGATAGTQVSQAFLQYKSGALTVIGGRFYTAAGYEVFPVASNLFVTRSVAYAGYTSAMGAELADITGESTYHTGVRASYALSDALAVNLGVNNGVFADGNDASKNTLKNKTFEVGGTWSASSNLSLALTAYLGKVDADSDPDTAMVKQSLYSFVASYNINKDLNVALNVDQGNLNNTNAGKYTSMALYGSYTVSDKVKAGVRLENITQKDSAKKGIGSVTGVVSYAAFKNLDLRTEVSDVDVEGKTARSMQAAVQGVLKF